LLVAFEDGVEELEDELLLFAGEELELLELALKLRLRAVRTRIGHDLRNRIYKF
jgi:hypothetical protein